MFDDIPPPTKAKNPNSQFKENRKPRGRPIGKRAEQAARRAKKLAEKELQTAQSKVSAIKAKVDKKKEALKTAENIVKGKSSIITEEAILEVPRTVQEHVLDRPVVFQPNPGPQTEFLAASEREVFYGGARGGGKSYSLIVDPLRYCDKEAARALILRRTMPELRDLINHSLKLYSKAFPGAKWREQEKEWRFPSGARIEFGYAETRQDALRYQGQSYTWIGIDELPQYPDSAIWNDLRGSLRSVDPSIPEYMRATGNPGNVGSNWVKEMFINPSVWNTRFTVDVELPDGSIEHITRKFIPAKLQDNPYLTRTKSYMTMLASLPEIQRRQWLEGDWDVWDGAAFPEFKRNVHVCEPFDIPNSWIRFRACDWGYSTAAFCIWFAIDYNNNLYVYREFKTHHMTADIFAQKIRQLEGKERIHYGVMDSSVWAKRGDVGPGIVETMQTNGVRWRPSDRSPQSRKNGKAEIHRRLLCDLSNNEPSIKIFSNCINLINEIPTLPLDINDPEDVDTDSNDHGYDALRYGCMSRPLNPAKIDWVARQILEQNYQAADGQFGY
jgi:hypothetical protein